MTSKHIAVAGTFANIMDMGEKYMSSTLDFVKYVSEQTSMSGDITYRKMFGEYGFYCDGKFFACVCDNQLFIKITEAGKALFPDCETAPPYDGAKPYFLITELDDKEFLVDFIRKTCEELPEPTPKKKSAAKQAQ